MTDDMALREAIAVALTDLDREEGRPAPERGYSAQRYTDATSIVRLAASAPDAWRDVGRLQQPSCNLRSSSGAAMVPNTYSQEFTMYNVIYYRANSTSVILGYKLDLLSAEKLAMEWNVAHPRTEAMWAAGNVEYVAVMPV